MLETDWISVFLTRYLESLLESPLIVIETLSQVQYQKRIDLLDQHPTDDTLIDRLQGDLPTLLRTASSNEHEGISILFKGSLTNFIFKSVFTMTQPIIEEGLNEAIDLFEDSNVWTHVASVALAGVILSPLELIRTRLIVQSTNPKTRRYWGPVHALFAITNSERPTQTSTFLGTLYTPRLIIPTFLVYSLSALIKYTAIHVIQNEFGVDPNEAPVIYRLLMVVAMAVEAAIVTPFEMSRKRILAQPINSFARDAENMPNDLKSDGGRVGYAGCVEVSRDAYTGVFHCIGCILNEEGGRVPKMSTKSVVDWESKYGKVVFDSAENEGKGRRKGKPRTGYGVRSLFRGFETRFATSLVAYFGRDIYLIPHAKLLRS